MMMRKLGGCDDISGRAAFSASNVVLSVELSCLQNSLI